MLESSVTIFSVSPLAVVFEGVESTAGSGMDVAMSVTVTEGAGVLISLASHGLRKKYNGNKMRQCIEPDQIEM